MAKSSPPLISILVPIYSVEPYLSQCLDSLVNQTLKDLEIICINDGSTDNSLQIIQSYMQKDSRIRLLDKPNSGYGDSMNQGIKIAQGHYIGIVEPDDWIDLDAFEKLLAVAQEFDADLVKANFYRTRENPKTHQLENTKVAEIPTKTLISNENHDIFRLAPAVWSAIYKKSFLTKHHIEFLPTPGASYQDLGFQFKAFASARRLVLLPDAFIHYRTDNANSSVNNPGKVNCVIDEYRSIANFLRKQGTFAELAPAMSAAKFRNYHWNFQRLDPKLAKQFYQTWRSEMQAANAHGYLQKSDFKTLHWLALKGLLHFPRLTYFALTLKRSLPL